MVPRHKTKQYLLAFAKVLALLITFGIVWHRLFLEPAVDFSQFYAAIVHKGMAASLFLLLFSALATANWYLEILKWKRLASTLGEIDLFTAAKQSLASHSLSLATPNRIGDYGAKALFYKRKDRKRILLLNLCSNTGQLLATLAFGLVGLGFFTVFYPQNLFIFNPFYLIVVVGILLIIAYFFRKRIHGFGRNALKKYHRFLKILSRVDFGEIVFLSVLRYGLFSSMFLISLYFFNAEIALISALILIATMYLLVSVVPTIFIFDFVVRGGVAVWLFSFEGVPALAVISTVLLMWIFNFVLPAIVGSYFVLSYQSVPK